MNSNFRRRSYSGQQRASIFFRTLKHQGADLGASRLPDVNRLILFSFTVSACTTAQVASSIHSMAYDFGPTEMFICMGPDGGQLGWDDTRAATGQRMIGCPAPARIVLVPACAPGQSAPQESAALRFARVKDAFDNSLYGDNFEGKPHCQPHPVG
jgi:hypothetical protein